jgi:hypothetical protein
VAAVNTSCVPVSVRTRERPDEGMQTIYGVATLIVLLHLIAAGVIVALVVNRRPPL